MHGVSRFEASKVPAVTLGFWIIKIAATTLGETGGDALSMTMKLGYAVSTGIFLAGFLVVAFAQIRARRFHPFLYWAVIVATTTAGTTMADFADRSLGIGYIGGSLILFALLLAVLGGWWSAVGTVSVDAITTPKAEAFYWVPSWRPTHSAPHSAISWRMIQGLVSRAAPWSSPACWRSSRRDIFSPGCPARCCSGQPSS